MTLPEPIAIVCRWRPPASGGVTNRSMNRGCDFVGSQHQKMTRSARSRSSSKAAVTSPARAIVGPAARADSGRPASTAAPSVSARSQAAVVASSVALARPVTSTRRADKSIDAARVVAVSRSSNWPFSEASAECAPGRSSLVRAARIVSRPWPHACSTPSAVIRMSSQSSGQTVHVHRAENIPLESGDAGFTTSAAPRCCGSEPGCYGSADGAAPSQPPA